MEMKKNVAYKEVKLDGKGIDRFYVNPLTNVFQYEYALFAEMSERFGSVRCKSLSINSLSLYFKELPQMTGKEEEHNEGDGKKSRKSREKLLAKIKALVERDVIGHICFPMMNICAVEVKTVPEEDGSHTFIFTDGIYGISLHLDMPRKGHPKSIEVRNISCPIESGTRSNRSSEHIPMESVA